MESNSKKKGVPLVPLFAVGVTAAVWIAHMLLRSMYPPGHSIRLIATVGVVVVMAIWALSQRWLYLRLEEFQQRVALVAFASAFPMSFVLVFAITFLRAEGLLATTDPRDLPSAKMLVFVACFGIAWRSLTHRHGEQR